MDVPVLPTVNASFNALSSVFLSIGYVFIRRKMVTRHRAMMLSACAASALFLAGYLTYHFSDHLITRFPDVGLARTVYLAILGSHTLLAMTLPVLVPITLVRGLRLRVVAHRRIARWTLPVWLYVSVTGVVVYILLYHVYA